MRRAAPVFFLALVFCPKADATEMSAPGPQDRVLVVAPHPDDEALGASGLLGRAKKAGAAVRVVYLTHGDDNEVSSLFYLKKPLLTKFNLLKIGEIREEEAEVAMGLLGIPQSELIFLGYPDGGTLSIWRGHWGTARPFKHLLADIDKVPYENDFSYGSPYKGENVLNDLKRIFSEYRPTHVFVTAPFDRHADHRAAYLFTQLALLELEESIPRPALYGYVIHARRWPRPRAYRPIEALEPPEAGIPEGRLDWARLPLSAEEVAAKKKTISKYESQMTYTKKYLLSFVRTNELFLPLAIETPVAGEPSRIAPAAPRRKGRRDRRAPPNVGYFQNGREWWIDVRYDGTVDEMGGLRVELYPYRRGRDFAAMPKFTLRFFGRQFTATDASGRVKSSEFLFRASPGRYEIRVPLSLLGDPDRLFASASTVKREWTPDLDSWKLLEIKPA